MSQPVAYLNHLPAHKQLFELSKYLCCCRELIKRVCGEGAARRVDSVLYYCLWEKNPILPVTYFVTVGACYFLYYYRVFSWFPTSVTPSWHKYATDPISHVHTMYIPGDTTMFREAVQELVDVFDTVFGGAA